MVVLYHEFEVHEEIRALEDRIVRLRNRRVPLSEFDAARGPGAQLAERFMIAPPTPEALLVPPPPLPVRPPPGLPTVPAAMGEEGMETESAQSDSGQAAKDQSSDQPSWGDDAPAT